MIQCIVTVYSLGGIQNEQFVYKIQSVWVFHIRFQAIFNLALLALGQVQFLVQLILIYIWPNLEGSQGKLALERR